jgi:hypothetical protein
MAKSRKYAAAAINSVSAWKPMPLEQAAIPGLPALNSPLRGCLLEASGANPGQSCPKLSSRLSLRPKWLGH